MTTTFQQARQAYAHEGAVRSQHTLSAYLRAVDLFFTYLDDRQFKPRLPLQEQLQATIFDLPLEVLTADDEPILANFAAWLAGEGDKRPYSTATIELRTIGVLRWLEFVAAQGWLPSVFSLENAVKRLKTHLEHSKRRQPKEAKAVDFEHDLSQLMEYYAQQKPSRGIQTQPAQFHRWELTRLRNHALIQTLAETGGQISAILSLTVARITNFTPPLMLEISGKNAHSYHITLSASLPALKTYLALRDVPPATAPHAPLFVSHDAHHEGRQMSRIIAWRIVQRAAKAVGVPEVSPHDLRHWHAKQLIAAGYTPEQVQQQLGHRSAHTIRVYYGHWFSRDEEA